MNFFLSTALLLVAPAAVLATSLPTATESGTKPEYTESIGDLWQRQLQQPVAKIDVGACRDFAVMGAATATCAGAPFCAISGKLGVSPGTSITGNFQGDDILLSPNQDSNACALAGKAAWDAGTAMTGGTPISAEMGGKTFTPGLYTHGSALNIALAGPVVTIDAQGDEDAVFVFKAGSLTTCASSQIKLVGKAKEDNVFWVLGTALTMGADSLMVGTVLAGSVVTIGTNGVVHGRVITQTAVTCETACTVRSAPETPAPTASPTTIPETSPTPNPTTDSPTGGPSATRSKYPAPYPTTEVHECQVEYKVTMAANYDEGIVASCNPTEFAAVTNMIHSIVQSDVIASMLGVAVPDFMDAYEAFANNATLDVQNAHLHAPTPQEVVMHMDLLDLQTDLFYQSCGDSDPNCENIEEEDSSARRRLIERMETVKANQHPKEIQVEGSVDEEEETVWTPIENGLFNNPQELAQRGLRRMNCGRRGSCGAWWCCTFCSHCNRRRGRNLRSRALTNGNGHGNDGNSNGVAMRVANGKDNISDKEKMYLEKFELRVGNEILKQLRRLARLGGAPCLGNFWELTVEFERHFFAMV